MHVSKKAGHFDKLCDRPLVEISGLEPELAEPKSVVLPLHHTSIPFIKVFIFFRICKPYGLRSCFELFEMFFEVKNLHFLPASSVR